MATDIITTQASIHEVSTIIAIVLGLIVLAFAIKKLVAYLKYKALERRLTKIVDDALRKCDEISMLHNEDQSPEDSGKKE